MITLNQVEVLLKEASMEYIRHGTNKAEVEHYAKLLLQLQQEETIRILESNADGFVGK